MSQAGKGKKTALIIVPKLERAYMVGTAEAWEGPDEFVDIVRVFDSVVMEELDPVSLAVGNSPGNNPGELAFNYVNRELFVRQADRLSVIDTSSNELKTETEYLPGTLAGGGLALDARSGLVYVPCFGGGAHRMLIISARDYSIVTDIEVSGSALYFHTSEFDPGTGRFFAAGYAGIHVFGPRLLTSSLEK